MITWLSRNQNRIKVPFFLGCIVINVGKHAETESLIKKKMHFKRKYFSKIYSEQILTSVKIYLHIMGHGGNCSYFHQADFHTSTEG